MIFELSCTAAPQHISRQAKQASDLLRQRGVCIEREKEKRETTLVERSVSRLERYFFVSYDSFDFLFGFVFYFS